MTPVIRLTLNYVITFSRAYLVTILKTYPTLGTGLHIWPIDFCFMFVSTYVHSGQLTVVDLC